MSKSLFIFLIFVILLVGVFYLINRSSFLKIKEIEVVGAKHKEEIKNELIILLNSSKIRFFLGPENMLFWNWKIQEKIPASLFEIYQLDIKKDWRQKKIIIEAKERQPWLVWCLKPQAEASSSNKISVEKIQIKTASSSQSVSIYGPSTDCYWLDDSGIVFASAPDVEGSIIPKIIDENQRQFSFGKPFSENQKLSGNLLEIIKKLENLSTPLPVDYFLLSKEELQEITARTKGPKLFFSLRFIPQNLEKILSEFTSRPNFHNLEYIDFRVENRIYYK